MKIAEIDIGVNFGSTRTNLDIKSRSFLKLSSFSGSKYPKLMACSRLEREILYRHISQTRTATKLKFFIRHVFVVIMTHAKFYSQSVDGNFDFWHVTSNPSFSWAWRTTEKAGPDRVNLLI